MWFIIQQTEKLRLDTLVNDNFLSNGELTNSEPFLYKYLCVLCAGFPNKMKHE